jgi:hypothetical protein
MHRPWPRRVLAAFMAALSLLTFVGAGGAEHVCPMHDPVLARIATVSQPGHAAGNSHAEDTHGDAGTEHGAGRCCCTGRACVAPAVPLPAHAVRLETAQAAPRHEQPLPEYARRAATPAYFIPYANGPPFPTPYTRAA